MLRRLSVIRNFNFNRKNSLRFFWSDSDSDNIESTQINEYDKIIKKYNSQIKDYDKKIQNHYKYDQIQRLKYF